MILTVSLLDLIFEDQGNLCQRKNNGDGHCAENFKRDPEVGGLRAPHNFIQSCEQKEKQAPA